MQAARSTTLNLPRVRSPSPQIEWIDEDCSLPTLTESLLPAVVSLRRGQATSQTSRNARTRVPKKEQDEADVRCKSPARLKMPAQSIVTFPSMEWTSPARGDSSNSTTLELLSPAVNGDSGDLATLASPTGYCALRSTMRKTSDSTSLKARTTSPTSRKQRCKSSFASPIGRSESPDNLAQSDEYAHGLCLGTKVRWGSRHSHANGGYCRCSACEYAQVLFLIFPCFILGVDCEPSASENQRTRHYTHSPSPSLRARIRTHIT
jgi:hypothetical protein